MVIRSTLFDDVYFSVDNGLEETRYVFHKGNNLPEAWQGCDLYAIAETGFGTGLNFLATWKLFEESEASPNRLHFISVEKYPLSKPEITGALSHWDAELAPYIARFLDVYPLRVPGVHHIHVTDRVTLTLWIGDIHDVLPEWTGMVDAWFLDGFTPAKNPDMWSQDLYDCMARLSHDQTTYATFTAAGDVRRGLAAAGFSVEKAKGFGRKRDMVKGHFEAGQAKPIYKHPKSVAIVGGGLAGTAMAHRLRGRGVDVTLYEAQDELAKGASGGRLGMVNPKLTAKPTPHSDYYTAAYAHALRILPEFHDVDFQSCGSLHLCADDDKDRRFTGYCDNLGWHADHIYRTDKGDLMYPDAGVVSPLKLCAVMAEGIDVRYNAEVTSLDDIDADVIILAQGHTINHVLDQALPVHSVRGQVTWVQDKNDWSYNLCFGGYLTPFVTEGYRVLGSTFQAWDTDVTCKDADHHDNIARYNAVSDQPYSADDIVGGWAALRTSSKDRFPIVGQIADNIYISTAHGSHGIISSLMAADILTAMMFDEAVPASRAVLNALSPTRFHKP